MTSPIPDRAVLEGLLERVRSALVAEAEKRDARADAAVRALEEDIYCDLGGCPFSEDGMQHAYRAPAYLRSLDAITALVASRGFGWQVDQTEGAFVSDEDDQWHETCATPALSLVGAWLVAEMEREEGR